MEEGYEDDDDTHFCIKCHATINGLENYIRHRQSGGCRSAVKSGVIPHSTPPSTPTTVSYPEILNADAFFSSLELQSSSKKESLRRAATPSERGRKSERQETRRRTRKSQADADDASTKVQTQEKLHNMLPIVTDLDNPTDQLGIPSLVGFPDIVTPTAGKSTTVPSGKACIQQIHSSKLETTGYHVKSESLPETSLDGLMVGGAETKHDRKRQEEQQEWLDDGILVDLVAENKEMAHSNLTRYAEFDYQPDEESDDESLDDDLGEEESYSETSDPEDRKYPPQGHTGGKWKPELEIVPQDMGEEEVENDEDPHEHPPPSYTGGKWKPTEDPEIRMDRPVKVEYESKDTQPPPGHTKGKWVPGARADVAATGYWCSPCGRKLASRVVYDRHLLSDLHARRSMQEIDGALRLPRGVRPLLQRRGTSRRQRASALKSREAAEPEEEAGGWRLRRREKEILWCEMCHARVRRPQMGKHLLSHYHCHVAGANPRTAKARRFLLENMANVVRQCPFQCAACRFYCNTEDTFLLHWRSSLHRSIHSEIRGSYQCAPCDFWCDDGDEMESHVISSAHREVVSLINGSVPVVVRRQRPLNCGSCDRRFRYNLQLRIHAKETGHEALTGSDDYQRRLECSLCSQIFRSLVSLQRHQLTSHVDDARSGIEVDDSPRPAPYFCSFCSLNFTTANEAVLHRRTSSHKETVRATKATVGASASTARECPHCGERRPNLVQHKEHLLRSHPELCHKCPRCGMLFALPQDVSRHTKDTKCSAREAQITTDATKDGEAFTCDRCDFATDSRAEFMFHQALHAGSVNTPTDGTDEAEARGSGEVRRKYRCPVCPKTFVKVTLRNHLRLHTGERPFSCRKCFASFSRRSALNAHTKECASASTTTNWGDPRPARPRDHVCSECNNAFYTKHALRQHTLRHAGKKFKCRLPGCPTVLRTAAELRTHRRLVHYSTEFDRTHRCMRCTYAAKTATQLRRHQKKHQTLPEEVDAVDALEGLIFSCRYPDCSFRTKLKSHLTRHVRCHTGSKPYKCRHCAYASNNLENLRKHVVSTNLHPGKTIYECDYCAEGGFCTNFAKELRAHLLEVHGERFPTPVHSSDYVAGIFEGDLLRRTSPR